MIINVYKLNDEKLIIKSDLAAEYPIYIYLSDDKKTLLYSNSIKNLLDDERVIKPLNILDEGISFLLQSGVVPPPKTIYKNIFIVSIGDKAIIETINNKVEINFSHEFPFLSRNREKEAVINENEILELLAEATIQRLDESKPSYLFHSAGKDSNMIALALAEAGYQNKVTCISHQSKGEKDESEISKEIATKLGFKHQKLYEIDSLKKEHFTSIDKYFINAPFPCTDEVTLAYSLYATQINFLNTNIIDGMGNDVYIGHIPSKAELKKQAYSSFLKNFNFVRKYSFSESIFNSLFRTRSEWTGLGGFSFYDVNCLLNAKDSFDYWNNKTNFKDYIDFRASVRGVIIDTERFIRKIRNFADVNNSNLILPYTNEQVASYFSEMPEKYLFDKKILRNKILLRNILKNKIDLDSDKLGKKAFSYDLELFVIKNLENILLTISDCSYWNKNGLEKLLNRFGKIIIQNQKKSGKVIHLIYRLYLISSWLNKNRYSNAK